MENLQYILLALLMLLFPARSSNVEPWEEVPGQIVSDFELTCSDGSRFCLSEALEEKELAVICLFGSGCGACQKELAALNKAYQLYQEQVTVIGLSLDRTYDTDEALAAFAQEHHITFQLGRDPARMARFMKINMYPAFMIVDADRTVLHVEVNGPASIDHFAELFDTFLGQATDVQDTCTGDACPIPAAEP